MKVYKKHKVNRAEEWRREGRVGGVVCECVPKMYYIKMI
jgi:hypothetical protein